MDLRASSQSGAYASLQIIHAISGQGGKDHDIPAPRRLLVWRSGLADAPRYGKHSAIFETGWSIRPSRWKRSERDTLAEALASAPPTCWSCCRRFSSVAAGKKSQISRA